jgi:ABC-type uncharacterized transport system involved in gliding motility auxiliary subunit
MATKSQNILSLSMACSLVLLVVLVLVNVVFARTTVRVDLTEEGLYTLADGSRRMLQRLEDPATIKVFWHNVTARGEPMRRYLAALLEEMRSVAGDRLTVRWVDMESDDGKKEAENAGVRKYSFRAVVGSEIHRSEGYSSLAIEYGDAQPQTVEGLVDLQTQLEYQIVSTLARMTRKAGTVVGVVSPRPSFNPFAPQEHGGRFNDIGKYLSELPGVTARTYVTLDEPVAPDVKVLLVLGPANLEEKQAFHLEQFVLRGGKLLLLADPVNAEVFQGRSLEPQKSGLEDWLGHLGLTVEKGVAMDYESTCLFPLDEFQFVRYPYWIKVLQENMDARNPALANLHQVPLYWPAPLSYDKLNNDTAGRKVTVLATTTGKGHNDSELAGIREPRRSTGRLLEKVTLALLVEGPMESFWKGKPSPDEPKKEEPKKDEPKKEEPKKDEPKDEGKSDEPKKPDGDAPKEPASEAPRDPPADAPKDPPPPSEPPAPAPAPAEPPAPEPAKPPAEGEKKPDEPPKEEPAPAPAPAPAPTPDGEAKEPEAPKPPRLDQGNGLIVLLGDAELVSDDNGPRSGLAQINGTGGYPLVINLVDWLAGGDDLLALRARATKPRSIEDLSTAQQDLLKWVNIVGVPVLVLFVGIVVFFVRRYQR